MRSRRHLVAALGALALWLGVTASAPASTWTVRQLSDGPTMAFLWGVSCPTESLCAAVGTNGTVATSTDPAGPASSWATVHPEGYFEAPGGGAYMGNAIRGVSCPDPGFCAAAGPQGNLLVSTDPTGSASAWRIAELGLEATRMTAISCPTRSLCVAVAYAGKVIASTNPTGGASAWTITELEVPLDLLGVSCASASLCAAVDNEGRIAVSTDPTGGASAWQLAGAPAGDGSLNGISCPALSLCLTGNAGQMIFSTDPGGGLGSWKAVDAGTGLPVKGVSCPSTGACAAVDNNADVIVSTEPTGSGDAWSFENVIPPPSTPEGQPNGMFGISCPSRSLCVAVGKDSQIIASTNPFAEERIPIRRGRGPRVRITRHPPKRIDARRGGVRVVFGFRAIGKASRFKCRIDRRRFARCRSPRRYEVGRGKHVFRVFAIAPTGLKGPRAAFHFRVGRLIERRPVGSCKPGQESRLGSPCIPRH